MASKAAARVTTSSCPPSPGGPTAAVSRTSGAVIRRASSSAAAISTSQAALVSSSSLVCHPASSARVRATTRYGPPDTATGELGRRPSPPEVAVVVASTVPSVASTERSVARW